MAMQTSTALTSSLLIDLKPRLEKAAGVCALVSKRDDSFIVDIDNKVDKSLDNGCGQATEVGERRTAHGPKGLREMLLLS